MLKKYIVYILLPVLAACGHSKSKSSGGGGEPKPVPANFKPFMMQQTSDCAGFRRSFNYIKGEFTVSGSERVGVKIQLNENGTYQLDYQEQKPTDNYLKQVGVVRGTWVADATTLLLKGAASATIKVDTGMTVLAPATTAPGLTSAQRAPVLALTDLKTNLATLNFKKMYLTVLRLENEGKIQSCAPSDNPKMTVANNEFHINGKPALEFWKSRLYFEWYETRNDGTNVGNYATGFFRVDEKFRVQLKVLPSGVFNLKQWRTDPTVGPVAEIAGTWKIVEGLVVLDGAGFISPFPKDSFSIPALYLTIDPQTKKAISGELPSIDISGWGN